MYSRISSTLQKLLFQIHIGLPKPAFSGVGGLPESVFLARGLEAQAVAAKAVVTRAAVARTVRACGFLISAVLATGWASSAAAQAGVDQSVTLTPTPTPTPTGAQASDPATLEWMTGFPPVSDKLIAQPFTDFWSFPKIRWSVCHLRELLPTRNVSRGLGAPTPLRATRDLRLAGMPVATGEGASQPLSEFLVDNYTDGFIVLHQGVVRYEYYDGCLTPTLPHATMSMTKSVTGLLGEMLIADGVLDDSRPVTDWIPELADSAFAGATLRQVMNMTTGVAFDETYSDPNSDIWVYARASDAMPKPGSYDGPVGFLDFLVSLKRKEAEHGERFKYGTINTDVLGWVLSRATGQSVAELVEQRLWQPMGAELDAYYKNDALGIVHAGGGLNAGLRDLARLGQLLLNGGRVGDRQVISPAAVESVLNGARIEGAAAAAPTHGDHARYFPAYRSMWWYGGTAERPVIAARGVYGQTIYIDPVAEVVMVRLASDPQASSYHIDPRVQPVYRQIADSFLDSP